MTTEATQRMIRKLLELAEESETVGASHVAGWTPVPNIFDVPPLTNEQAKAANDKSLERAKEYRDIAARLQRGETVPGWSDDLEEMNKPNVVMLYKIKVFTEADPFLTYRLDPWGGKADEGNDDGGNLYELPLGHEMRTVNGEKRIVCETYGVCRLSCNQVGQPVLYSVDSYGPIYTLKSANPE